MATHQHPRSLRPPPPPRLLHPVSVSVSARCIRRARPLSASFRPPPQSSSLPYPLPRKRAEEAKEAEERREYGGGEYVSNVGDGTGLLALLRAGRAGPGGDPVFFMLTTVAVTTSVAFSSMVAVAVPTMLAMRRAANLFTMLADAALEELPSTMAAVRLSGMEISDLTVELSDLSHEISDGVNKSAKVAQAVETSIGQMRDIARQQAISMVKERANLQTIPPAGPDKKSRRSSSEQQQRKKGSKI